MSVSKFFNILRWLTRLVFMLGLVPERALGHIGRPT